MGQGGYICLHATQPVTLVLGHVSLILCCLGQKTFQAGSVGRLNNDNNSYVSSGFHLCVAEAPTHAFNLLVSSAKVNSSPTRNAFAFSPISVTKRVRR